MKQARIVAVVVGLLMALSVTAQDRGNRMNQTFTERYGTQLNLTDAQKKDIDVLDQKFQKDHAEFLAGYQKTMTEYRQARMANDTVKTDAMKAKVESLRAEMTKLRTEHEEKIAKNFTEAQNTEWKKIKEEREARMKQQQQH